MKITFAFVIALASLAVAVPVAVCSCQVPSHVFIVRHWPYIPYRMTHPMAQMRLIQWSVLVAAGRLATSEMLRRYLLIFSAFHWLCCYDGLIGLGSVYRSLSLFQRETLLMLRSTSLDTGMNPNDFNQDGIQAPLPFYQQVDVSYSDYAEALQRTSFQTLK